MNKNCVFLNVYVALKTKKQDSGTSRLTVQIVKFLKRFILSFEVFEVCAEGHVNSNDLFGWFPVQVQATVHLKVNDTVGVKLIEGSMHESGSEEHVITGFGGFLVSPLN